VGRVVGRFYDASGRPSELLRRVERQAAEAEAEAERQKQGGATGQGSALPCNVNWSSAAGERWRRSCRRAATLH
jgi:hypothetical protein